MASRESSLLFTFERGLVITVQARQEKKALTSRGRGISQGFPRAAAPVGVFSQGTTRISGDSRHFHALEKEMATHSSVLAWRIPWTEKPGRLHHAVLSKACNSITSGKNRGSSEALGPLSPHLGHSTGRRGLRGLGNEAKNHPLKRGTSLGFSPPTLLLGPTLPCSCGSKKAPQSYPSWPRLLPTMQKPR